MSHFTTTLGMTLATPGTGEAFSTAVVNGDFIILENGILADRTRLTSLEAQTLLNLADVAALTPFSAAAMEGRRLHVDAMNIDFQAIDGLWTQQGTSSFPDAATRDAEYAKASGAFKVNGVRSRVVTEPFERYYSTSDAAWKVWGDFLHGAGLIPIVPTAASGTTVILKPDGRVLFTAAPSITIDGIGSTDFDDIFIKPKILQSAANTVTSLKLRTAGADDSNAVYDSTTATGQPSFQLLSTNAAAQRLSGGIDLVAFNLAEPTQFRSVMSGHIPSTGAAKQEWNGGAHRNSTQMTGITIALSAGTGAGSVEVFGYNRG